MFRKFLDKSTGSKEKQSDAQSYLIPKGTPQKVLPVPGLTEDQIQDKCMLAAKSGDIEVIKTYVNQNNINMVEKKTRKTNTRNTLLHYAAENNQVAIITYLVEMKANLNAKDICGYTPVHSAARKGSTEALQALIKAGALLEEKDNVNHTPLMLADCFGRVDAYNLLRKHTSNKSELVKDSFKSRDQEIIELKATVKALQERVDLLEKANKGNEPSTRFGFAGKF